MTTEYYYSLTKHPKVFKNCYWGTFKETIPHYINEEILQNRNSFANEYELSSRNAKITPRKEREHFHILLDKNKNITKPTKEYMIYGKSNVKEMWRDHKEWYYSKKYPDCIIGVFSMHVYDEEHKTILESGYEEIKPIYATGQKTYIKIVKRK